MHRLTVGSIPRSITIVLQDDLVDRCKAGDDVTIVGLLRKRWKPPQRDQRVEVEMAIEIVLEIVSRSTARRATLHPVATLLHSLGVEVATLHPLGVEVATRHPPATLPPYAGWWRWRGAPSWDNGTDGTRPGLPAARCPSLTLTPNPNP